MPTFITFIGHRPHLIYLRLSRIRVDHPNCSQVTGWHQRCRSLWYFDYVITGRCGTKLVSKFQDEPTSFRNNDKYPAVLFLLPPIFLVANRTESILRGQPPVCLRNAIIMRLIICANFCLLARRFVATQDWILFNYTSHKNVKYKLVIIYSLILIFHGRIN